jgi:hypothetical protein
VNGYLVLAILIFGAGVWTGMRLGGVRILWKLAVFEHNERLRRTGLRKRS